MSSMSFEVRDPLRHKRTLSRGSPGREDMMVSSFLHSSYSAMTSADVLNTFNWNRHCSSLIHFTPEKDRVSHRTHASRFCEAGRGEEAIVKCTFRMRAGSTRLNRYSDNNAVSQLIPKILIQHTFGTHVQHEILQGLFIPTNQIFRRQNQICFHRKERSTNDDL